MQIIILLLPGRESWHIGAVNEAQNRGGNQIVLLDCDIKTKNQVPPANMELKSAFKEICLAALRAETQISFERFHHQPLGQSAKIPGFSARKTSAETEITEILTPTRRNLRVSSRQFNVLTPQQLKYTISETVPPTNPQWRVRQDEKAESVSCMPVS
jgi:hypothetical protein